MNDIERVRAGVAWMREYATPQRENEAMTQAAVDRIESALRALTAEHGSQCQCQGCAVLR